MIDAVQDLLERTANEDRDAVLDPAALEGRVQRRRRRRRNRRAVSGILVIVVVVVAGAVTFGGTGGSPDDTVVADEVPSLGLVEGDLTGLDGRSVRVRLPASLGAGLVVVEQNAELTVADRAWRVTTRRGGVTSTSASRCDVPERIAVTGVLSAAWTVEISGDDMNDSRCEVLVDELDAFVLVDELPRYRGDAALGPIDAPDVRAVTDHAQLSLFWRSCETGPDDARTASGLYVHRLEDPARRTTLTELCDTESGAVLWIEADRWPTDDELDAVSLAPR
jgi:hypothetical protein